MRAPDFAVIAGTVILASGGAGLAQSEDTASGWTTFCTSEARDAPFVCVMEQIITLQETGQQFASMRITTADSGRAPNLILQLPLGIAIQQGVQLQVDELEAQDVPLTTCEAEGCFASLSLGETLEASLKAGSSAVASFENLAGQEIRVEFLLQGFTAGLAKLQ